MADTSYEDELAAYDKKIGRSGASQIPGPRELTYEEQLAAYDHDQKHGIKPQPKEKVRAPAATFKDFEGQNLKFGPWDTGLPINPGIEKSLAQIGSGMADLPQGSKQLLNDITESFGGKRYFAGADKADADEKRRIDDPLNRGFLGTVNNLAGKIAPSTLIPSSIPASMGSYAPAVFGAASGALQGAMEPVSTGESRGANMLIGGLGGGAVPAAKAGLQRASGMSDASTNAMAQEAINRGINSFGTVDTAQPGFMTAIRRVAEGMPGVKGYVEKMENRRNNEFTRAVSNVVGLDTDQLTGTVLKKHHDDLEQAVKGTWASQPLVVTRQMRQQMSALRAEANRYDQAVAGPINERLDALENRIRTVQGVDPKSGIRYSQDIIDGDVAYNFKEGWRKGFDASGVDTHQRNPLMEQARKIVTDTFENQLPSAQRRELTQLDNQFQATKAILPAAGKGDVAQAQREVGAITPQDLSQSIKSWYGPGVQDSPYGRLAEIGQRLLRDTSTKDRTLLSSSILPALGITGVTGAHMGYISNPVASDLATGLGGAIASLGGATGVAGAALSSPGVRRQVMNNAFDLPTQLSRSSTIQGPLAWREQTQADTALDQEFGPKSPEQQDGPLVNTENVDVPTIEEPRYRVEIKGTSADEKPSRRR